MPFAFAFGSTRRRVVLAKPCGGQRGKSIGGVCTRKRAEIGGCLGQTGRPVASGMSARFGDQLGQIGPLLFDLAGDDAGHVAVGANVSRQQGVHQTLKHIEGRREHLRNIINVPTRHPSPSIRDSIHGANVLFKSINVDFSLGLEGDGEVHVREVTQSIHHQICQFI